MKMKLIVALIMAVCLIPSAIAETVIRHAVTAEFPDVTREGIYSGEVNSDLKPHGYGVFEAVNSNGVKYIAVGDWTDGTLNGDAWEIWEDGIIYVGEYQNGRLIKGKISNERQMVDYDIEQDVYASGFSPDNIFSVNLDSLDDESILELFKNMFGSDPVVVDTTLAWDGTGYSFCGMPLQYGVIMTDNEKITMFGFVIMDVEWKDIEQLQEYIEAGFVVGERLNARVGKKIVSFVDDEVIENFSFDEPNKMKIASNAMLNGATRYSGFFAEKSYSLIMDVQSKINANNILESAGENRFNLSFLIMRN